MLIVFFFIVSLLSSTLIGYMFYKAHHDTITYQLISHQKIPPSFKGFNIFFIADVHRRLIKDSTLNKVNKSIDLVLIGGDLIEKGVPLERMRNNLIKLNRWKAPIYFVWGNNDYETDTNKMIEILQEHNVRIMEDTIEHMYRAEEKINLIGLKYFEEANSEHTVNWEELDDAFSLLFTHKPSSFYELPEINKKQIHLVLAGHTHGGQIRLFGFGLYEKGGTFTEQHSTIIITEGYGYTMLPLRLETKSECHVISLNCSTKT